MIRYVITSELLIKQIMLIFSNFYWILKIDVSNVLVNLPDNCKHVMRQTVTN